MIGSVFLEFAARNSKLARGVESVRPFIRRRLKDPDPRSYTRLQFIQWHFGHWHELVATHFDDLDLIGMRSRGEFD